MLKTTFILINGPQSSGKTSIIAPAIVSRLNQSSYFRTPNAAVISNYAVREEFSAPIKKFLEQTMGMPYADIPKNTKTGLLDGLTPREFSIDLSERYIKPNYGKDFYAKALVHRVTMMKPLPRFCVVDDLGFLEELAAVVDFDHYVIHVSRPGYDFKGDSRNYIHTAHGTMLRLENDGMGVDLHVKSQQIADTIIKRG